MGNQPNQPTTLQTFDGERGMPGVNDLRLSFVKRGVIILVLFLIVGAGAGVIYLWNHEQDAAREAKTQARIGDTVPARTFTSPPPLKEPEPVSPEPIPSMPDDIAIAPPPVLDKSGSGLMAVAQASAMAGQGQPNGTASSFTGGGLSPLLSSTRVPLRPAGHMGDRNFILAKGSFIDCALQTKLDSTVPGMTACVVTRNIYSDNGKVLLIERGSTISGEYQSNLSQGMARIFVLWSRIKTPNGIVINLDSPATDPLGGAGMPGWVDTHFWERFGGALLLSLIDNVARYVAQGTDNNSGQINFDGTGDAAQTMAAEALRNTINIPPTLYKNQGEQVGVYVARDLDFSEVYDVAAANE